MRFRTYLQKSDAATVAWGVILISIFAASVYIIQKEPFLGNDSYGYLKMYLIRPAGYPLFLFLLRMFGDYHLTATVVVQTLMNAVAFIIFIRYISQTFDVHISYMLFLLPWILYYFVEIVAPEKILTESIAFPIFLVLSIFFMEGVIKRKIRSLIIVLIINTLLVTVRGQFLFVFPLTAMAGGYIIFRNRNYWTARYIAGFMGILFATFFSTSLINKTYHFVFNGTFNDAQMNMSFIRNALYVSGKEDSLLFEDEKIRKIYGEIYDSIYVAGHNMDGFYDKVYPEIEPEERRRSHLIEHYHKNLNNIAPFLTGDIVTSPYNPTGVIETNLVRDQVLKEIAFTLLKSNISNYLYISVSEIFMYGFSGNRVYLLMFFILVAVSFFGLINRNSFAEVLFFFLTAHIANLVLMALSDRILARYMYYIEFIIIITLFLLFIKALFNERVSLNRFTI